MSFTEGAFTNDRGQEIYTLTCVPGEVKAVLFWNHGKGVRGGGKAGW